MMISRDQFVAAIEATERVRHARHEIRKAAMSILNQHGISQEFDLPPFEDILEQTILELLEVATLAPGKDTVIRYWFDEARHQRGGGWIELKKGGKRFPITNASELWDALQADIAESIP